MLENPVKLLENPVELRENPVELRENPVELLENPVEFFENPAELLDNPVIFHFSLESSEVDTINHHLFITYHASFIPLFSFQHHKYARENRNASKCV